MENTKKTNTNKNTVINAFYAYKQYTIENDCHVIPTKSVNSGNCGRLLELAIKLSIGNYRGATHISSAKQKDTFKKLDGFLTSFEIKSGCGVIANIDQNGKYYGSMLKSNYVVYVPEYNPEISVIYQAYVLPVDDFIDILKELGLLRLKYSGNQYEYYNGEKRRKPSAFYDRLTIQTFTNSKKKKTAFYNQLDRYGETLTTFFNRYGITLNEQF